MQAKTFGGIIRCRLIYLKSLGLGYFLLLKICSMCQPVHRVYDIDHSLCMKNGITRDVLSASLTLPVFHAVRF